MTLNKLIQNRYWIILGILFAFDDIAFFANFGGPYLASPAWIAIIPLIKRLKPIQLPKSTFLKLGFVLLVITCVSLFHYSHISLTGVDQSILLKIIKNLLELLVYLVFVFLGFQLAFKSDGRKSILLIGGALYATSAIGFLLEKYSTYDAFEQLFHATTNVQQRVRGFRFEASSLGSSFLIASALILICLNGRKFLIAFLILVSAPLILVESRGYVLAVTIVIILCTFRLIIFINLRSEQFRSQRSWLEVGALLVMIFGLPLVVQANFWSKYSADVSDTTRSMWAIMIYFVLLHFPFGMGFGNSVVLLPKLISDEIVPYMQRNFVDGNYSEIAAILASKSDSGMYPKTLPGYIILVSGWLGAIVFLFIYIRMVRQCMMISPREGFPIYIGFFLLIAVSCTYFGSSFSWDQAFLFGAVYGLIRNGSSKSREIRNAE